jgi:hypothetical protein
VTQEVASSRRALVSSSLSTISRGPSVVVTSWALMPAAASRCRDSSPSMKLPGDATDTISP